MSTTLTSTQAALLSLVVTIMPWNTAIGANTKDMVLIPQGEFTMGSKDHSDETPHRVVLDRYYIDKYEVSNAKFQKFMKETKHTAPAYWDDPRLNAPEQPVVGVNWYDASTFCKWEGKRLPTEAEWEKAAKGPDESHYPWGHKINPTFANYAQNEGKTRPVNSYEKGVSGYGVFNMAGNVFEWVSDWYGPKYFQVSRALNPQGPSYGLNFANQGPVKVIRGGSWFAPQTSLHTSHRFWNQPENNSYGVGLGFRCAMTAQGNSLENVQYHFISSLISMGEEKWKDALQSINKAIKSDPENMEYKKTREIIMKKINM